MAEDQPGPPARGDREDRHGWDHADPTCPIRVAVRRTHALHQLAGADSVDTDRRRTDARRMHRTPDVGHQTPDTGHRTGGPDGGRWTGTGGGHWTGGRWTRRR
jgi:hypothetical protein